MSQSHARKKNSRSTPSAGAVRNEKGPYTHVVVGDGSVALWSLAAILADRTSGENQETESVLWLKGAGAQVFPPVAFMETDSTGLRLVRAVAQKLGWTDLEIEEGQFIREFRNKAFREPTWYRSKAASTEQQLADRNDSLWGPEQSFAPLRQIRVSPDLGTLEGRIRQFLAGHLNCVSLVNTPLQAVETGDGGGLQLRLGNGRIVMAQHLVFADRWSALSEVEGLPKPMTFMRGRDPHCLLQAVFTHEQPSSPVENVPFEGQAQSWETTGRTLLSPAKKMSSLAERPTGLCFFTAANKDSGETVERQVWGYFMDGGRQSVWSIAMEREEAEDNHHVAKKLRRIHQAIEKLFSASEADDADVAEAKTPKQSQLPILDERVSFEESRIFSSGTPLHEPLKIPQVRGLWIATDGYGVGKSLAQVEGLCDSLGVSLNTIEMSDSDSQSEAVDLTDQSLVTEDVAAGSESSTGRHEVVDEQDSAGSQLS
jgi:hypothetical protein